MLSFKFLKLNYSLFKFNQLGVPILTLMILLLNQNSSTADVSSANAIADSTQIERTIRGRSGGSNDTQGCGFIPNNPSYEMNLETRIDYLRFTVRADGGQPTLLVIGPNSGDSFCVLGDRVSGLDPEISGVWEPGYYQIYVGDRTGSQHQFALDISTSN